MRRLGLNISSSEHASGGPHEAATHSDDGMGASAMSRLEALVAKPLRHAAQQRAGRFKTIQVAYWYCVSCSFLSKLRVITCMIVLCAGGTESFRYSAAAIINETLSVSSHELESQSLLLSRSAAEQLLYRQAHGYGCAADSDPELSRSLLSSGQHSPSPLGNGIGMPATPAISGTAPATPLYRHKQDQNRA